MSYESPDNKARELELDSEGPMEYRRAQANYERNNDHDHEIRSDIEREKSRDVDPAVMWAGPEGEDQEIELEPVRLSTIRIILLTVIMVLTYFLGVSLFIIIPALRGTRVLMGRRYQARQSR
jgi:Flp pilus assembly protein TadB